MSDLTAVSLFAGIGGIDLALKRAGVNIVAAVEIDPACRSVLARHFPQAILFDDVRTVTSDQLRAAGFVPGRGILAGGWPCTGNSVAGGRAGMADPRSGLWVHIPRLLAELRPRWFLGENVPGLYSVNDGQDIAVVRADLAQCGYWWAERILDAQYFGVPQRRRRVFFAGCLGDRAAPVQVLFEPEGSAGDSAQSGQAGQNVAGCAANGAGSPRTVGTLGTTGPGGGWRVGADEAAAGQLVTPLLEVNGRVSRTSNSGLGIGSDSDPMFTLRAGKQHGVAIASTLQGGGQRGHRVDAEGAAGGHLVAMQCHGTNVGPMGTLKGEGLTSGLPFIAHTLTSEGFDASEDGTGRGIPIVPMGMPPVASPLTSGSATGEGVNAPGRRKEDDTNLVAMAFNWQTGGTGMLGYGDKPTALQASQITAVQTTAVRRLTPLECERLQGFPDNWTKWLADGTGQSDSARYRQCGNAVAVPVVEWIAHRLVAADAALAESEEAA